MDLSYFESLLSKYQNKGIVIDTNLLLLYFIGKYDVNLISRFKRTKVYTVDDFSIVDHFFNKFSTIITTPNILTEVSNLSHQLNENIKIDYFNEFKNQLTIFEEKYHPSTDLSTHTFFNKYGLTDTCIMTISSSEYLVFTDDFKLSNALKHLNIDVINLNQIHSHPIGMLI